MKILSPILIYIFHLNAAHKFLFSAFNWLFGPFVRLSWGVHKVEMFMVSTLLEVGGLLSMVNTDRSTSCDNERIYPSDFGADRQKKQTPPLDSKFKEVLLLG